MFTQNRTTIVLGKEQSITKDQNHNAFPSVLKLEEGLIIVSYRKGKGHLSSNASAVFKSSLDNGKSFNEEYILDDGKDFIATKYGIRNLIVNELNSGKLIATYWVNDGIKGYAYYKISTDKGVTWGDRREIRDNRTNTFLVGIEGKIIEFNSEYFLPVFVKMDLVSDNVTAGVMISSDLISWTYYAVSRKSGNNNESAILLDNKKDELIYFYRNVTENGLFRSVSKDRGRTWLESKNVSFLGYVQSRPDVGFYLDSEEMYLLYREGKYQTGAMAISKDKGNTWRRIVGIQEGNTRFTYGSMVNIEKNNFLLIYSTETSANGITSSVKSRFLRIIKKVDGD